MNLWIPGANGLLGSALLSKVSAFGTTRSDVDIADLKAVRSFVNQRKFTHIVNCAAYSLVDGAESEKEKAYAANVLGPENLAIVAKESGAKLIHIGTDYVFPGNVHRPLREDDVVGPCNYYGETKLQGEQKVLQIYPEACVLRTSWIFGNGGKNFVAKLFQMIMQEDEVRLSNDQWGRPTYAPDLVNVILKLFGKAGLYQFANAGVTTKYDFGVAMVEEAKAMGLPVTAQIVPVSSSTFRSPCKRPVYSAFDTTKIERELHLKIRHWKEALKEFICNANCPIS